MAEPLADPALTSFAAELYWDLISPACAAAADRVAADLRSALAAASGQ